MRKKNWHKIFNKKDFFYITESNFKKTKKNFLTTSYLLTKIIHPELDKKGFLQPDHKRQSMIRNINNIFHRLNLSEQEIRILLGIFSTLNEFNKKS